MTQDALATGGLVLTDTTRRAMAADGIEQLTATQVEAITAVLAGKHVLLHSGTGSGKTLAYLLPVLQRLRDEDTRAVVFAPGAELVMQTLRVANAYKDEALPTGAALTTSNPKRERKRVQRSTKLVVGTPDRLLEMFRGGKLKGVNLIVLDEPEPILGSRDAAFLRELLSRSEPKVQLIIASATLGERLEAFVATFMPDVARVTAAENPLQHDIDHWVVQGLPGRGREMVLAQFVQEVRCHRAIVFVSDPRQLSHLYHYLRDHSVHVDTLSHERTKLQRQRALDDFRSDKLRLLLTTDATARGIDVPDVDWVLHYDLPHTADAYTHRAGRTGRAGKTGTSVVFVDGASQGALRRLSKALKIQFVPFRRR